MMTDLSGRLLDRIQSDFPLTPTPYKILASEFNVGEDEIIEELKKLKDSGVIRRIGASMDSRKAGHVSTLVGCRVDPVRIEEIAGEIGRNPGVTHSYERNARFNLWFTLIAPDEMAISETLGQYRGIGGVYELESFPASKIYKIKVTFRSGDD